MLLITVHEVIMGRDKQVGACVIGVPPGPPVDMWVNLRRPDETMVTTPSGPSRVRVRFAYPHYGDGAPAKSSFSASPPPSPKPRVPRVQQQPDGVTVTERLALRMLGGKKNKRLATRAKPSSQQVMVVRSSPGLAGSGGTGGGVGEGGRAHERGVWSAEEVEISDDDEDVGGGGQGGTGAERGGARKDLEKAMRLRQRGAQYLAYVVGSPAPVKGAPRGFSTIGGGSHGGGYGHSTASYQSGSHGGQQDYNNNGGYSGNPQDYNGQEYGNGYGSNGQHDVQYQNGDSGSAHQYAPQEGDTDNASMFPALIGTPNPRLQGGGVSGVMGTPNASNAPMQGVGSNGVMGTPNASNAPTGTQTVVARRVSSVMQAARDYKAARGELKRR